MLLTTGERALHEDRTGTGDDQALISERLRELFEH